MAILKIAMVAIVNTGLFSVSVSVTERIDQTSGGNITLVCPVFQLKDQAL